MPNKQFKHGEPSVKTKKQILIASGNQCAFPGCNDFIFDRQHTVITGKIAHIKARSEGGPRFDINQSEEENMSLENLIVLCGKHHDIIDERADIYTTECLTSMKNDHEEKVENTTDRSWIKFPNLIIELGGLEATTINYWIDRTERCQVYTDRKLVIAKTVMDIYLDINRLCNLYDLVEQYPESPAKNLMQDYVKLDKNKINLDLQTNRSALVHVLARMAEIPEITFGELLAYIVTGGDTSGLITEGAKNIERKIQKIKDQSYNGNSI